MSTILPQVTMEVKLIELVARADKLMLALMTDEDEDSPVGRAITDWLRDAEDTIGRNGDCGCVLPGQSCPTCEAAAREVNGDDELPF